jgi:predicted Co/Zn/Cd cation transporter (cation efflux family)
MVLPRLIPLLEKALNSSHDDLTEALKNLESQVSSVESEADPQIVQSLTSEFPPATNPRGKQIKLSIEVTATTIKSTLLKEIQTLENEGPQSLNADLYRTWLTKTMERYEQWLSRL